MSIQAALPVSGLVRQEADAPDDTEIENLIARCAKSPGLAEPRLRLARALLRARRAAEAVMPAEQALALAPQLAEAAEVRQAVLKALYSGDPELVKLELACALDPADAAAHLALGEAYAELDRPHDAERHLKSALRLGRACEAHADLGALYLKVGMIDAARHHAVHAIEAARPKSDNAFAMAHQTLASILEAQGDIEARDRHLDQAYARRSFFRQSASGAPFTTLVLVSREGGNVPYRSLLPPARSDTVVWYMEHARLEQVPELPTYDVVLNAIGDPDAAVASIALVKAFVARCPRRVLNPPGRVEATFRHRLAETLAGVDGAVIPRTLRISAETMAERPLSSMIAEAGLLYPVLVRPIGSHGGKDLTVASDEAAADEAAAGIRSAAYISQFHDYRSEDGFFRKHRMIFVDRRPFAYHLAISPSPIVHHQTAEMAEDPRRIAEEMTFLRDPERALGRKAIRVIEAIGRRLDLDYGGVDFGLTRDGQVLVFEANATMLTHLEPDTSPFVAKNVYIQPILDAFQAHLAAAAAASAPTR